MKLGIVVVYYAKKHEGWLIRIHLSFIRKNTLVPYKIYAGAERLFPEFRKKIVGEDIVLCHLQPTDEIAGKENSFYLEQLFHCAIDDGCTHIAVFHVDSFPVRTDWVNYVLKKLDEGYHLAAIERIEEQDNKPHSSFMFFSTDYYQRFRPPLRLSEEERKEKLYRKYLKEYPHIPDTGTGFGYQLFKENLKWYGMHRSNSRQDHRLFAGIYDDIVFHLGGAGFTMAVTHIDKINYNLRINELKMFFNRFAGWVPVIKSLENKIFPKFEDSRSRRRISNKNKRMKKEMLIKLANDPDRFVDYLRMK